MNGAESLVRTLVVNGVEGGRATTLDGLATQFMRVLAHRGPYLVELVL